MSLKVVKYILQLVGEIVFTEILQKQLLHIGFIGLFLSSVIKLHLNLFNIKVRVLSRVKILYCLQQ